MTAEITHISLFSQTGALGQTALFAMPLPGDGTAAPDWIHLVPSDGTGIARTRDGRGPFQLADPEKIIAESMMRAHNGKLPIDINHATDKGEDAPAVGWIVELQARSDGIWGRVEWNAKGQAALADKLYSGISPVLAHDDDMNVNALLRAALTNTPAMHGLTAIFSNQRDTTMTIQEFLIATFGLKADASDDEIKAAVTAAQAEKGPALAEFAAACGLQDTAGKPAILSAIRSAVAGGDKPEQVTTLQAQVTTLQSEVTSLSTQLASEIAQGKTREAETFIDGAIREGRVGVKLARDAWIKRFTADPEAIRAEIGQLPTLGTTHTTPVKPTGGDGTATLTEQQRETAKALGIAVEDYAKTLQAEEAGGVR